ncbi:MAG: cupredoxin domain-containing protein [Myxococcota bacterium]
MTDKSILGLVLLGPLAVALAGACDSPGPSGQKKQAGEATVAERAAPKRVHIEVKDSGYEPSSVEAEAGQPLTLAFERVTERGCGEKVVIPSFGIERDLPVGEKVEVELTPEESGELAFTCGMNMLKGKIVVN